MVDQTLVDTPSIAAEKDQACPKRSIHDKRGGSKQLPVPHMSIGDDQVFAVSRAGAAEQTWAIMLKV
jgi:hypothetical protein